MSTLHTRKPTGAVGWPCILVEGGEGSGKSYLAALLTASERVGRSFWLEIGTEGTADEYAAIPGVCYELLVHDGTWRSILDQVEAVRDEAAKRRDAGEPPVVLVIDTMTAEWEMHSDWADNRARDRESRKRQEKGRSAVPVDVDVTIGMDLWNDAKARHRKLMTQLLTFPGIVVLLARAGETALVRNGRPVEGQKDYKVRGEKDLAHDATAWIRLDWAVPPRIVKLRSVHAGIRPGHDAIREVPDLSLDWLIFDLMRCDPAKARVRDIVELKPGNEPPAGDLVPGLRDRVLVATADDPLRAVWVDANAAGVLDADTTDGGDEPTTVRKLITDRRDNIRDHVVQTGAAERVKTTQGEESPGPTGDTSAEKSQTKPTDESAAAQSDPADAASHLMGEMQKRRLFALLGEREIKSRDGRLRFANHALERDDLTSFGQLTANDASRLINQLEGLQRNSPAGPEQAPPPEEN